MDRTDLHAAQARLLALRRAHGTNPGRSRAVAAGSADRSSLQRPLPAHLGWGCSRLLAATRSRPATAPTPASPAPQPAPIAHSAPPPPPETTLCQSDNAVLVYPDMALALLRQQLAAPGRIWLLLRHLDTAGRGWLDLGTIRTLLTERDSDVRLCGKRRLRQALRQGDGIFWRRDRSRLWLRGLARVAATLDVDSLRQAPVYLSLEDLVDTIGATRAALYATFHGSRRSAPIGRHRLESLTGTSPSTQRRYEARRAIAVESNYAIGPPLTAANRETVASRHGAASFVFTDVRGAHGAQGRAYLAWQLPNSYRATLPRGSRQKRHQRRLQDLRLKGSSGNMQPTRRFYAGAAAAAKRSRANQVDGEQYWHGGRGFWYPLVIGGTF